MNEEKYYTPEISDLRVGYEFERCYVTKKGTIWYKYVIKEHYLESDYSNGDYIESEIEKILIEIKEGEIRTAYLTKGQIEEEGWVKKHPRLFVINDIRAKSAWFKPFDEEVSAFWVLDQRGKNIKLSILKDDGMQFGGYGFYGSCPSVNELRYISKLLNIK